MNWEIDPGNGMKGELIAPADKSISHRAIMFSSIAEGISEIRNFLMGEDCLSTLKAFRALGVDITVSGDAVAVKGVGLNGLAHPDKPVYLGNSGTSMRIISGILSGQRFETILTGDSSLSGRPMNRIIDPLKKMGAKIESIGGEGKAPLKITPADGKLNHIVYATPVASAQVKSCILAAGLYADGQTVVKEPFKSRDHTERMLISLGADLAEDGLTVSIRPGQALKGRDITIPGDISSAAFFIVGALILQGSDLLIKKVGMNPTRKGILNVLKRMGANIEIDNFNEGSGEAFADLRVRYSELNGTDVEPSEIPLLIDEIPILLVAAAFAEGATNIKGADELKVKETNRVESMAVNLSKAGIDVYENEGSITVKGGNTVFSPARFESYHDHRTAMSMAIASLRGNGRSIVQNTECVLTSYPDFMKDLKQVTK